MNYIEEVNAFYDWLETNSVSDSAIVLWHALMHINSKTGWRPEFTVAISTLSTKTGLKKDAIGTARNRLQQAGRIRFTSRSGQQSAIYSIIPFASVYQTLTPTQNHSGGLTDTNTVTNRAQTPPQSAHKQPPLDISLDLKDLKDREIDKDRLRRSVIDFRIQNVGAFGLDIIDSYLGVVETDVIEMAIKRAEGKSLQYFQTVINNWIKEGKTKAALINPIPAAGEFKESARDKPHGNRGYSKKPILPVVKDDGPTEELSPEQLAEMRERARRLAMGLQEGNKTREVEIRDDDLPF
ncbi:hypothetical protein [Cohnella sp. AR92]|uniref:hypothetical protein n=1 Tax=Cohnella sp. AR92 TaxID=648716 RepID=UPI000F8C3492|nr:hypothetical protein [Cohnella sp. AR92]RUS42244.1 hypothetical protein ELR57_26895 [Cohnella sp. AR92]